MRQGKLWIGVNCICQENIWSENWWFFYIKKYLFQIRQNKTILKYITIHILLTNVHLDCRGEGSSNRIFNRDASVETEDESVETRDESIEAGEKHNNHVIITCNIEYPSTNPCTFYHKVVSQYTLVYGHLVYIRCGKDSRLSWWRYQMETFLSLLALCEGNSQMTVEFPSQRSLTQSFDVWICARTNGWANYRDAVIWDAIAFIMPSL